ncbi:unnamed protein product [Staurois parvus]|uniref:Uncharacterized protein n=1 Tax=Staurois parvus TaxID=386267 RepID=A0ABN9HTH6_9NEOB|nr:unnamed protein product [Staurois parvus]
MDAIVILSLITMALFSTTRLVHCAPLGRDDALRLREEESEETEQGRPETDERDRIVTFLALLEKAERIASSRFAAQITGIRANNKLFGKKNRMDDIREEQANPGFHQEESIDQMDELTDHSPMKGKHFRKVSQGLPRKSKKKRACFWKYCIKTSD